MDLTDESAEKLIATMARSFQKDGKSREVEILRRSSAWFNQYGEEYYDRFYDSKAVRDILALVLELPIDIYNAPSLGSKEELGKSFTEKARFLGIAIDRVELRVLLEAPENWREGAIGLSETIFGLPSDDSQYRTDIFMLMPFSGETAQEVYADRVIKIAAEMNMSIRRGDDFFTQRHIMTDVWNAINAARLIIADCTGRNPNVFYELGIAHALAKKTILITENSDDIPFDIRALRYIEYKNTPRAIAKFEADLKSAIERLLDVTLSNPEFTEPDDDGTDIPF